ncbi:MAG: DUF4157 domain-containing protein [Gemmatimonadota bacterium]|nr:DUF4157 domain-containing protein [Gemmatimonadota bacterium]
MRFFSSFSRPSRIVASTALLAVTLLPSLGARPSRSSDRALAKKATAPMKSTAAAMTCSGANGSLSPCSPVVTVAPGSTNTATFTITNSTATFKEGGFSCSYTAPVTSCGTFNPIDYQLNGHASQVTTVRYTVSATPGTGTFTIQTGGLIGSLNSTYSVTVSAPISVTPKGQVIAGIAHQASSQTFTVTNNTAATATITAMCGGAVTACGAPSPATMAAHAGGPVSVGYTAGGGGSSGTVTLTATSGASTDNGSITVNVPVSVSVTPDNQSITARPGPATKTFTVANSSATSATFLLSFYCNGGALSNCTAPASVSVGANSSATPTVSFDVLNIGSNPGTMTLTASESGAPTNVDAGSATYTAGGVGPCRDANTTITPCDPNGSAIVGESVDVPFVVNSTTGGPRNLACLTGPLIAQCAGRPTSVLGANASATLHYVAGLQKGRGAVTLTSTPEGGTGLNEASTVYVTVSNPIDAFPDALPVKPPPFAVATQTFYVDNSWASSRRVSLFVSCTGTATLCKASKTTMGLFSSDTDSVTVTYSVGAVGDTGRVTLIAVDSLVHAAQDGAYILVTSTLPPPAVAVTPDSLRLVVAASSAGTQSFKVKNTGGPSSTYNFTSICSGSVAATCTVTPTSAFVFAGKSTNVTVTYNAGSSGPGLIRLRALYAPDTTIKDEGSMLVTIGTQQPMSVDVASANTGTVVAREKCLTISVGPAAAYECGDLRLAHALTTVRTMGKARTPILLYSSQLAHPYPVVAANLTRSATTIQPDSVTAALVINGATRASGKWLGSDWNAGVTARIALSFDGIRDTTVGNPVTIDAYTLTTKSWYGLTNLSSSATGQLAIVNRHSSSYGVGWLLAGVERLYGASPTAPTITWVDPDGSVRLYSLSATNIWKAPNLDRPDSLTWNGTNYIRWLPNQLQVKFDASGRHVQTVNRLGHTTQFYYTGTASTLDSMEVAPAGSRMRYRFYYTAGRIDSVRAPGQSGTLRVTRFTIDARGQITKIKDPDNDSVTFAYDAIAADSNIIVSRTNALGVVTTFAYDAAHRLRHAALGLAAGDSIASSFLAHESVGLPVVSSAVDTSLAYTRLDGPRFDVADTTLFWIDRYGEPTRIKNALGQLTTLQRTNATWPTLVTRTIAPNGRVTAAWYNARGLTDSTTDSSTYRDSASVRYYATTRVTWDPKWEFPTQTTAPEGEVSQSAYDVTTGNLLWQQPGTSSTRRVTLGYALTSNLLVSVRTPGAGTDSLEYDPRGNVSRTIAPSGLALQAFKDSLGRDTLIVSPIQTGLSLNQTFKYDTADQVYFTQTSAPTLNGISAQSISVAKSYDKLGRLRAVVSKASPLLNKPDSLKTTYRYDNANRKVYEQSQQLGSQQWSYDAAGNDTLFTTIDGYQIRTTFDPLGRPLARMLPKVSELASGNSEGGRAPADTQYFAYDVGGNTTRADNIYGKIHRAYAINGTMLIDSLWIRTMDTIAEDWRLHQYVIRHQYDREMRQVALIHPHQLVGTDPGRPDSVGYSYDPVWGTLGFVDDTHRFRFTYTYDNAGRLSSMTKPGAGGPGLGSESWGYDADSKLSSHHDADDVKTWHNDGYSYDARGKMINISSIDRSFAPVYSGMGALIYDNGQNGNYAFSNHYYPDAFGTYDSTSRTGGLPINYKQANTYGLNNELVTAVKHFGNGSLDSTYTTYDESAYASTSEITTLGTSGGPNVIGKIRQNSAASPSLGGITVYQRDYTTYWYNADNKLKLVVLQRDTVGGTAAPYQQVEEYRYDALGRRIWRRMLRGSTCRTRMPSSGCVSSIVRTVWDGNQMLYEMRTNADTMSAYYSARNWEDDFSSDPTLGQFGRVGYTYGTQLDQPLSMMRIGLGKVGTLGTQVNMIVHVDYKGAIDGATCVTGSAQCTGIAWSVPGLWRYDEDPPAVTPTAPGAWYGALGNGNADGSGLINMRNRYLDPKANRFTQGDPIGLAGGLNTYGFADGDPVNFSDPFGLRPLTAEERQKLGDECDSGHVDCDKVQVHTGNDDKSQNADREMWLKTCNGCSAITIGNDIYVRGGNVEQSGDVNKDLLAHEVTHVGQFQRWGWIRYTAQGLATQFFDNVLHEDQYSVPLPMKRAWSNYGMEQQATIVEQCSAGNPVYCAKSPYTFPHQ